MIRFAVLYNVYISTYAILMVVQICECDIAPVGALFVPGVACGCRLIMRKYSLVILFRDGRRYAD